MATTIYVFKILIALGLIAIGLLIGWLPGPGGVLAIIGLALLATQFRWVAICLDWIELMMRRIFRALFSGG